MNLENKAYWLRIVDFFFNVTIPVSLGYLVYFFSNEKILFGLIRNHLPDGLWAYALQSCMLIIWNRKTHITWTIIIMLFTIAFETLQYLHFIRGTGDFFDVLVYFIFFGIAIGANKLFILKTLTLNHQNNDNN